MIWGMLIIGLILVILLQLLTRNRDLPILEADRHAGSVLTEPDKTFPLQVTLTNRSRWPVPHAGVRGNVHFSREGSFSFTTWLLPHQQVRREFPLTVPNRGRYLFGDIQVFCGDFLGLQESTKTCGSYQEIVVAPTPLPGCRAEILMGGFLGDISTRRFILEDPMLTLGYREYTSRDPMKRIAWNQTARKNTLMVKQSDYTVEPSVSVIVNVQTDLTYWEEPLENCFRAARSVCELLEQKGIHYSFSTNTRLLGRRHTNSGISGLGQRHFHDVLEMLGRSCREYTSTLDQLLEQELQRPGYSGRILITPGGGETNTHLIGRLQESEPLLVVKGTEAGL